MFSLNFLKKSGPDTQSNRCHFQHQNGRRCRLPVADESTEFCGTHRDTLAEARTKEERDAEAASIYAEVMGPIRSLDSAVAINHVLSNLFRLTLQGRIPQRKAAQLTTQLRLALRATEAAKHEITSAKLFPHNNVDLLNLLALLNGDEAESETVAPHFHPDAPSIGASLHRDPEGGRTCAAAFSAPSSTSAETKSRLAKSRPAVVATGLVYPERASGERRASPRLRQPAIHEESPAFTHGANHETVAPQSTAAISPEFIPTSATTNDLHLEAQDEIAYPIEPAVSSTSVPPQSQSTNSAPQFSDGVCWIGPKPDQIDWDRIEKEKREYERYLRQAYPPTLNGYHRIPPDEVPLWWKLKKRR